MGIVNSRVQYGHYNRATSRELFPSLAHLDVLTAGSGIIGGIWWTILRYPLIQSGAIVTQTPHVAVPISVLCRVGVQSEDMVRHGVLDLGKLFQLFNDLHYRVF